MFSEHGQSCTLGTNQSSLSGHKGKFVCPGTLQSCSLMTTNRHSLSKRVKIALVGFTNQDSPSPTVDRPTREQFQFAHSFPHEIDLFHITVELSPRQFGLSDNSLTACLVVEITGWEPSWCGRLWALPFTTTSGDLVDRALDHGSKGRGFESGKVTLWVTMKIHC